MTRVLVLGAHCQIARVATKLLPEETDVELALYLRNAERLDHPTCAQKDRFERKARNHLRGDTL